MLSLIYKYAKRMSVFVFCIVLWLVVSLLQIYSPLLVPSIGEVLKTLVSSLNSLEFLTHTGATLLRIAIAFFISAFLGIFLGMLFGYYSTLDEMTSLFIDFIRSIPGIVMFPLFILFFGVGDISRLLVAIFVALPIVVVNTKYGVINSSKMRKNMKVLYKMSTPTFFLRVIFPEASPYIFTGLRIAISLCIIIIIVTEMMLGTLYGLGRLLIISQLHFDTPLMYAVIIILGSIGFLLNILFNMIEKKIFHWR